MIDFRLGFGLGLVVFFIGLTKARAQPLISRHDIEAIINQLNAGEFAGWFRPLDVLAIAKIESNFDPEAFREEPQLKTAAAPDGERSMGLMQILISTARDRGWKGTDIKELLDPRLNIQLGMRQLKWSFDFLEARLGGPPSLDLWIGSYNAGVGNALRGFTPDAYVAKWKAARVRLQAGGT